MKIRIIISLVFIAIILLCFTLVFTSCNSTINVGVKIIKYCKNNSEMKLSDVTNFDWDTAYVDYQSYGFGEDIKEKYGLIGDFQQIKTDYWFRIAFCKNSELVSDVILSNTNIRFEQSVETITPDTIFIVEWKTNSDNSKTVYLVKKD